VVDPFDRSVRPDLGPVDSWERCEWRYDGFASSIGGTCRNVGESITGRVPRRRRVWASVKWRRLQASRHNVHFVSKFGAMRGEWTWLRLLRRAPNFRHRALRHQRFDSAQARDSSDVHAGRCPRPDKISRV
jgi:hypothetical protein